ncbi:MAG TPA: FtsX-like permease family protein [Anaeromyxobacteraceae bacterium]|nr:FtsX-like permease family protein [Anaeromyxobacteraceae bacterium]
MLGTDLHVAARNLARHTRRNVLLGAAIAGVTAMLVLLGGLTAGMREAMLQSATTLMTGHVNLAGFFKITSGTAAPIVSNWETPWNAVKGRVPELLYAAPRGRGWAKAVADGGSMDLILAGVELSREPGFRGVIQVVEGNLDELAKPGTILIFQDQAKRLGVKVGDALTLSAPTTRGASNTADVRVAVVARNIGLLSAFNAFIPAETLRQLYQLKEGTTGAVQLYLRDPADSAVVAARLRDALKEAGWRVMDPDPQPYWQKLMFKVNAEDWTGQKLDVTTWEDEMSFLSWIVTAVTWLGNVLVTVLLVIVAVGIVNTLAIAIRERTREIGTLRAIGMQRTQVLRITLLEAALLGLLGSLAGAALGAAVAAALNAAAIELPETMQYFLLQRDLHLALHAGQVGGYVAFVTALTTLAAVWPSAYAARMRPVTAMHHVG